MKAKLLTTIGPVAVALLVARMLLVMTAVSKHEYVDASGILIEPFAYRVGGAVLTALGTVLWVRSHSYAVIRTTRPPTEVPAANLRQSRALFL